MLDLFFVAEGDTQYSFASFLAHEIGYHGYARMRAALDGTYRVSGRFWDEEFYAIVEDSDGHAIGRIFCGEDAAEYLTNPSQGVRYDRRS
jgi:hypothetical protein